MSQIINVKSFISKRVNKLIFDVRSPSEYAQGHMLGAINLPLFSDSERAEVGTLYKEKGKAKAVIKGLSFTGPKMESYANTILKNSKGRKEVYFYCARGGMRSQSMAFISDIAGFETYILQGGYKSFRNEVLSLFKENTYKLIVLGGNTGCGKTPVLHKLEQRGQIIVDLEKLANHKGSAFGSFGENTQPTVEQFENLLYEKLHVLDNNTYIWVEDESAQIGKVRIPKQFFDNIRQSEVIALEIPQEVRADYLIQDYDYNDDDNYIDAFNRIAKRLGGLNLKIAVEAIRNKDYFKAAVISLQYYDKAYNYGLCKREKDTVTTIKSDVVDATINAEKVLSLFNQKFKLNDDEIKNL